MRLPYIAEDVQMDNEADRAIVQRIKHRRGGKLIELDRALLHAPPVASGWNEFLLAVRTQTTLPVSIRESAICRVAVLNKAWYEWDHHLPILLSDPAFPPSGADYILRSPPGHAAQLLASSVSAEGSGGAASSAEARAESTTPDAVVDTISDAVTGLLPTQLASSGPTRISREDTGGLDDKHLAVLAYTDAMTVSVSVPDDTFAALRRHFNDREVVEITAITSAYNCVSRFLVALDVGERRGTGEGGGGQVE